MAAGCDQLQVLQLACPVDFSSLVRVFVPLRDGADAATAARAVRRLLHSSTGACVVQVLNHTALQVVCHKVRPVSNTRSIAWTTTLMARKGWLPPSRGFR